MNNKITQELVKAGFTIVAERVNQVVVLFGPAGKQPIAAEIGIPEETPLAFVFNSYNLDVTDRALENAARAAIWFAVRTATTFTPTKKLSYEEGDRVEIIHGRTAGCKGVVTQVRRNYGYNTAKYLVKIDAEEDVSPQFRWKYTADLQTAE